METKARIGLFVGGLVLVGMVAYVMMPRSSAKPVDEAANPGAGDLAGATTQPSTQPVAIADPFAAPAPAQPAQSAQPADAGVSVTTLGQTPAAGQPAAQPAPAQPADANDAWARALDGGSTQTRTVGGLSGHSSLLSDASSMGAAASAGVGSTSSAGGAGQKTYKVETGDSPFTISQKLFGDGKYASKIMAANPGVNAKRLKAGQELTIPDINASSSVAAAESTSVPTAGATASAASAGGKTYKVQAGDSLQKISTKLYGKSGMWKQIYAANKSKIGSDPTRLRAGMVLQLPEGVQ